MGLGSDVTLPVGVKYLRGNIFLVHFVLSLRKFEDVQAVCRRKIGLGSYDIASMI